MHDTDLTQRISDLAEGDENEAQRLFDQYYVQLVDVAKRKMRAIPSQVADDEGAVISAFRSFFSGVRGGQFPNLDSRDDLWRVLATLTARKSVAQIRHHWRKRGEADNVHEPDAVNVLRSTEPTADEATAFLEDVQTRIDQLSDDRMREIVLMRLEGWATDEIAEELNVHRRTVQRKLSLVERTWCEQSEP